MEIGAFEFDNIVGVDDSNPSKLDAAVDGVTEDKSVCKICIIYS